MKSEYFSFHDSLIKIAKASVEFVTNSNRPLQLNLDDYADILKAKRASFVTLNKNNVLRGCIGSLTAHNALIIDIAENAAAAAQRDPRFPTVQIDELGQLDYHISILSKPEIMNFNSEDDLIDQLRPGIDGLILTDGNYRGTFLPSVWESLPQPKEFLSHLKRKAGLSENHWSQTMKLSRYTAESISSNG